MQMLVARFASKDPQRQSVMQMLVARFASNDSRIRVTTNAGALPLLLRLI